MKIAELFGKNYIVGLDFGVSALKIVIFKRSQQQKLELIKAAIEELDSLQKVDQALELLLKDIDYRKTQFVISVNCPKTCLSIIICTTKLIPIYNINLFSLLIKIS